MKGKTMEKHALDNHSRQLDEKQPEYYQSRGLTSEQAELAARQAREAQAPDPGKPKAK
ncbi:hypothetical protein [Polyangium spumosum]|uniref:Uncharacterized protein n=1 Tax=Polyangium spumosum TaxID=889282 RepID=A0A6N7PIC6_9BACT|nr:hypothetical protein [Polyangium spumosum]MRG91567.1 hypothetical protein [Polyangium spumosum]